MQRTVTQNTTYLIGSYIAQKVLSFFYFVLIARSLAVADLGKYTFALSFTTLFAVFIDLGFSQALIRETAKHKENSRNYLSSIMVAKLVLAVAVYLVVAILVNVMNYSEITKQLVYLSGILMVIDQFTLTFWGLFRGERNLKYESISIIFNQLIILVAGVIVVFSHLPLIFMMLPLIAGSTFSFLFSLILARKNFDWGGRPSFGTLKTILLISLPFAAIAIMSRIYGNIDSVMLSKMAGDKAVAWYSVAMKIPFALQFIPAALAAAIFPAFSHHYANNREQLQSTFERVMKFLIIVVVPLSIGTAILADKILLFFYGANYLPSAEPLSILMLGLIFVFLNYPLGSLMNGCDRQVDNTKAVALTLVLNVAANVFLIPRYGFMGASVAFLLSHGFLFVASSVIANQIIRFNKKSLLIVLGKSLAASLFMGALIYVLKEKVQFLWLLGGSVVCYPVLSIFVLRAVGLSELKELYYSIRKKKERPVYAENTADNN